MASKQKQCFNRSLDLLHRAGVLTTRLAKAVGKEQGRVGAAQQRLQELLEALRRHRDRQPLNVRRCQKLEEQLVNAIVQCLHELLNG